MRHIHETMRGLPSRLSRCSSALMSAAALIILYAHVLPSPAVGCYVPVRSVSELEDGGAYLIAFHDPDNANSVMGLYDEENDCYPTVFQYRSNYYSTGIVEYSPETMTLLTLHVRDGADGSRHYCFTDPDGRYLSVTKQAANELRPVDTLDDYCSFTITISSDSPYEAEIRSASPDKGKYSIQYSSSAISSYKTQKKKVTLFRYDGDWYLRRTPAGIFGTLCLPYAVEDTGGSGAVFYSIACRTDGGIALSETRRLEACTPYIYYAMTPDAVRLRESPAEEPPTDTPESCGLVGYLGSAAHLNVPVGCYVVADGSIRRVTGRKVYINRNRAYIDLETVPYEPVPPSQVKVISLPDGGASGVCRPDARTASPGATFDAGGTPHRDGRPGIVIRDGRKYIDAE